MPWNSLRGLRPLHSDNHGNCVQLASQAFDESWTVAFPCQDSAGQWANRPHTAAQIRQVLDDSDTHIQGVLGDTKALLDIAIKGAKDVAEADSVDWPKV